MCEFTLFDFVLQCVKDIVCLVITTDLNLQRNAVLTFRI